MTETQISLTRQALKTPRSAAIAGIIFAVIYGASMVLLNVSLSQEPAAGLARTVTDPRTVSLALNLIPYAGIAFLWFIGVIRDLQSGVMIYGSTVVYNIFNIYAVRMAGVFMISLATIWLRTGVMHRGWAFLTYVLALVLLVSIDYSFWVTLILPAWVLVISVYLLVRNLHNQPRDTDAEEITS